MRHLYKRAMNFIKKKYYKYKFRNQSDLYESKVFCMAPWIQLHAQTNGFVGPCCMASMDSVSKLTDLNENPNLKEAWNCEKMRDLRTAMLKGERRSICDHCYKYEELGHESERHKYNRDYVDKIDRVFKMSDDGTVEDSILLLDLRFSNKCNYKCRICDSSYSSLWYEDEQKLGKVPRLPSQKKMNLSMNSQLSDKEMDDMLKNVIKIHFAGGEPLVMDEHYEVLKKLLDLGRNDVRLSYNTNFSTFKYKNMNVIDLWKKFDVVDVWASLDGMGVRGDYIRKGQRWDTIVNNIKIFQQNVSGGLLGVNITVSILNVFHLPSFIECLIDELKIQPNRINLYLLFDPQYYSITQLPLTLKHKVENEFIMLKEQLLSKIENGHHLTGHIDMVINHLNSEQGQKLDEFINWTKKIDELRGENFVEVFPELKRIYE